MKDTNGNYLEFYIQNNEFKIVEKLTVNTNLANKISTWNLKAIESINIMDSIEHDANRKKAVFKRKKRNNIITWAVIGGLLDGSDGNDSVIDGLLLGGLFGAVTSGNAAKPDFKNGSRYFF